ncbi:hypothetical protein GJ629_14010 [Halapricum sp. CBA1109]|uniref:hypothetical protein n=1 Tax=Halapricum sp. CBA1109 TaxID=2668068 RepID=UPI0012F7BC74|nr:hypothetical protein [Halapricum sp. CBA1109]MUV90874.1 hypothetical protein [Halapricum sp. CBA1109]
MPQRSGDGRWPGPTSDELLGQRAQSRANSACPETVVTAADETVPVPELPDLEGGVYLLDPDADGPRARRSAVHRPLQGLALDTAFTAGGDVVWIDTQGHATTHSMASVAPSPRALDRIHVARAFTTHQHHTLVEQVGHWLRGGDAGPFGAPGTDDPAVIVCPAVDALYRGGELSTEASRAMVCRTIALLGSLAREHSIPVVLTRTREDEYTAPSEPARRRPISLVETEFGARFDCDGWTSRRWSIPSATATYRRR